MASLKERDIFGRSLSGDWKARVSFFKQFVWNNSRIRRMGAGAGYNTLDDFLHDCFTNMLRTGHSFDPAQSLGEWVESVAAWTALDRQRSRDTDPADSPQRIRLCAGIEGDEAGNRARLIAYAPPSSGHEDSLASRVAGLLGEPQFTLLSKRAIESSTWDDVAAAAGRPLNTIVPMLVRTVDRFSRFFGAPPSLNDDLEPVFSSMRDKTGSSHGKPEKPKGRILSMQLDSAFYPLTPEMRRLGLTVPSEARTLVLWDAARASTAPSGPLREHLSQCRYCADLLRALLRMQQALQSRNGVEFLLCPGGYTLLNTPQGTHEALDRHLDQCGLCRNERSQNFDSPEETGVPVPAVQSSGDRKTGELGKKVAWVAAALLLVAGGYYAQLVVRSQTMAGAAPSSGETPPNVEIPAQAVAISPRYRDLVQTSQVTDSKWLDSVLLENRTAFNRIIQQLQARNIGDARLAASGYGEKDPGIQMLYSFILYLQSEPSEAYRAMRRSEAMPPRNSFRCWSMLQSALLVGELQVARREVEHLSSDPEYAARARNILAQAEARK